MTTQCLSSQEPLAARIALIPGDAEGNHKILQWALRQCHTDLRCARILEESARRHCHLTAHLPYSLRIWKSEQAYQAACIARARREYRAVIQLTESFLSPSTQEPTQ